MNIQACVFSIYYPTVIITKLIAACIRNVILFSYRKKHLVDKKKYITFANFFGKEGICSKLYHPRVT